MVQDAPARRAATRTAVSHPREWILPRKTSWGTTSLRTATQTPVQEAAFRPDTAAPAGSAPAYAACLRRGGYSWLSFTRDDKAARTCTVIQLANPGRQERSLTIAAPPGWHLSSAYVQQGSCAEATGARSRHGATSASGHIRTSGVGTWDVDVTVRFAHGGDVQFQASAIPDSCNH